MNSFRIHAKLPGTWAGAEIWAWNEPEGGNLFEKWPGEAMTDEGNGYYLKELPEWVNSIIISSCEGNIQTEKIEIRPRELWIEIREDISFSLSYDCPQIMLRALLPASWKAPLVWGWSETSGRNVFDSWPGKVFHWDGEVQRISLPYWTEKIIISADGCQLKSEAIELPGTGDAYLKLQDASHYKVDTKSFGEWEEVKVENEEEKREEPAAVPEREEKPAPGTGLSQEASTEETSVSSEPSKLKKQLIFGAALISAAAAAVIAVVRLIRHR